MMHSILIRTMVPSCSALCCGFSEQVIQQILPFLPKLLKKITTTTTSSLTRSAELKLSALKNAVQLSNGAKEVLFKSLQCYGMEFKIPHGDLLPSLEEDFYQDFTMWYFILYAKINLIYLFKTGLLLTRLKGFSP